MQVESDIAPYKGLLMGLFFMTVGMEISVGLFFAEWKAIISGIVLLIVGKVRGDWLCMTCGVVQFGPAEVLNAALALSPPLVTAHV